MSDRSTVCCVVGMGLLLAACSSEGSVRIDTSLTQSEALRKADQVGTTLELPATDGTLVIESAAIKVSELELEGGDDDVEFETDGRTVGVALDGTPTEIAFDSVSEGTYDQIGLELASDGSVTATGSYNGTAFSYVSSLSPEVEYNLPTPAVVAEGSEAAVEVSFDVAAWFLGADGLAIDPNDPANRATIEDNILKSITANAAEVELTDDDAGGDDD